MSEIEQTAAQKKAATKKKQQALDEYAELYRSGQSQYLPSSIGLCKGCFSQASTLTVKPHIGKAWNVNEIELSKNRDPQTIQDILLDKSVEGTEKKKICGVFLPCKKCSVKRWLSMGEFGFNNFISQLINARSIGIEWPYFQLNKDKDSDKKRSYNILIPLLPKAGPTKDLSDEEYFDWVYDLEQKNIENKYDYFDREEKTDTRI